VICPSEEFGCPNTDGAWVVQLLAKNVITVLAIRMMQTVGRIL
jgi:hypothetical protein